ncbi:hypothetical protein EXN66_Car011810 [Channa argus]|uniref:Uncharacterized protein n=1 Tax=Channa argus TaxID=215402 RepID=A0A6G1Q161_CHAAH|nr:hypothetical protein EXN66_Car011810 [Channa argus]
MKIFDYAGSGNGRDAEFSLCRAVPLWIGWILTRQYRSRTRWCYIDLAFKMKGFEFNFVANSRLTHMTVMIIPFLIIKPCSIKDVQTTERPLQSATTSIIPFTHMYKLNSVETMTLNHCFLLERIVVNGQRSREMPASCGLILDSSDMVFPLYKCTMTHADAQCGIFFHSAVQFRLVKSKYSPWSNNTHSRRSKNAEGNREDKLKADVQRCGHIPIKDDKTKCNSRKDIAAGHFNDTKLRDSSVVCRYEPWPLYMRKT